MITERTKVREQDPKIRACNFEEVSLGFNLEEAQLEANRCLHCKVPHCVGACPVGIDIPGFIQKIKEGDVNLDDEVDSDDRDAIVTFIMGRIPEVFYKCLADLNNDNKVNAADLVLFVNAVRQVK